MYVLTINESYYLVCDYKWNGEKTRFMFTDNSWRSADFDTSKRKWIFIIISWKWIYHNQEINYKRILISSETENSCIAF